MREWVVPEEVAVGELDVEEDGLVDEREEQEHRHHGPGHVGAAARQDGQDRGGRGLLVLHCEGVAVVQPGGGEGKGREGVGITG